MSRTSDLRVAFTSLRDAVLQCELDATSGLPPYKRSEVRDFFVPVYSRMTDLNCIIRMIDSLEDDDV